MKRRNWLLAFFTAGVPRARAQGCPDDLNQFACLYNAWINRRKARTSGITVDAREEAAWLQVKAAWRKFSADIDRGYGL